MRVLHTSQVFLAILHTCKGKRSLQNRDSTTVKATRKETHDQHTQTETQLPQTTALCTQRSDLPEEQIIPCLANNDLTNNVVVVVLGNRFGLLPVHCVLSEDPLGDPFRCPQVVWFAGCGLCCQLVDLVCLLFSRRLVVSCRRSCSLLSRWDLVGCPQFAV